MQVNIQRSSTSGKSQLGFVAIAMVGVGLISNLPLSYAFSVNRIKNNMQMMDYKPPVKNSVEKFYNRRLNSGSVGGYPISPTSPSDHPFGGGINKNNSNKARSSSSSSKAAASYAAPTTSNGGLVSFERRMREAIFGITDKQQQQQIRKNLVERQQKQSSSAPSNLVTIESLEDYKTIVGGETERLVVVRFHASYCRACKAVTPHFWKLARNCPNVVFVDVPVTERTAVLHRGLGIPSLPYAHLYHPNVGLVEEQSITRKLITSFANKLQCYMNGQCDISWEEQGEIAGRHCP